MELPLNQFQRTMVDRATMLYCSKEKPDNNQTGDLGETLKMHLNVRKTNYISEGHESFSIDNTLYLFHIILQKVDYLFFIYNTIAISLS